MSASAPSGLGAPRDRRPRPPARHQYGQVPGTGASASARERRAGFRARRTGPSGQPKGVQDELAPPEIVHFPQSRARS